MLGGSGLWGRRGGAKLILDGLRRANGRDEGIFGVYDDAVLECRRDLEAVFVLDPSRVARDTCYTASAYGIEETNLYADTYVLGIIHWDG